jgi:hypothetical protein
MTRLNTLFAQRWTPLHNRQRDELVSLPEKLRYPGVYLLTYSGRSMTGRGVRPREVIYVGMTNSSSRLPSRSTIVSTGSVGHTL